VCRISIISSLPVVAVVRLALVVVAEQVVFSQQRMHL
jgi:hypothetical protein